MNATELVKAYAVAHRDAPGVVTDLTPDLHTALEAWRQELPQVADSPRDLADVTVDLLEGDPGIRQNLELLDRSEPQTLGLDPLTIGLSVAALVALQSYVKIERTPDGKWSFTFEKKPLSDTLLGQFLEKLLGA